MRHGHWVAQVLIAPEDYPEDFLNGEAFSVDCCSMTAYHVFEYADNKSVWLMVRTPRVKAD